MMVNNAIRWSGLLLIAGAALLGFTIIRISFRPVVNQQFTAGISQVFLLSSILLLLSFPGMYMRQANSAGWLGLAGFALLQTGISTIQAKVFPLWSGIMLLLATAAIFFMFLIAEFLPPITRQIGSAFFGIVLAIALIWIGISIWIGSFS